MLKPPNWHQNKEYVRVIILEAFCYKGGLEKIMSRWSKKKNWNKQTILHLQSLS